MWTKEKEPLARFLHMPIACVRRYCIALTEKVAQEQDLLLAILKYHEFL
jgi:hypothetical protein